MDQVLGSSGGSRLRTHSPRHGVRSSHTLPQHEAAPQVETPGYGFGGTQGWVRAPQCLIQGGTYALRPPVGMLLKALCKFLTMPLMNFINIWMCSTRGWHLLWCHIIYMLTPAPSSTTPSCSLTIPIEDILPMLDQTTTNLLLQHLHPPSQHLPPSALQVALRVPNVELHIFGPPLFIYPFNILTIYYFFDLMSFT